ncbi:MAG: TonB-dependent receptor [Sphingobacteriaceae bacterium]|nr:TonB-dependent receptor [Sphingobacteriaceae bacterium]
MGRTLLFFFLLVSALTRLNAQEKKLQSATSQSDSIRMEMPQVVIIGKKDRLFTQVPGSVSIIDPKELKQTAALTSNEVLRKIPGLNVVDEEGAGLRLNIGSRGLDPDRSRNVLVLEDGIPIALGPYGEPELYFSPSIDKMAGVEVVKGSGQILFGPQTTGGVLNMFTFDPPATEQTRMKLSGGMGGIFSGLWSYGNSLGKVGFLVSYLHKTANKLGQTWFQVNDLSAKIKLHTSKRSSLGLKLGMYHELSNSTYIGLTQTMFDAGGQDYAQLAPLDRLPIKRYSISATHKIYVNPRFSLQTTAFGYTISRNWQRQDFTFNASASNKSGQIWGDTGVSNGAIYMLNSSGNRNRQFAVAGLEPQVKWEYTLFNTQNELQSGVRYLYEQADEQFIIGQKANASAGDMRDSEVRRGNAVSFYAQNKITLTPKLSLNVGVRYENFKYERQILRGRFTINNQVLVRDTNLVANNDVQSIIPGAGVNYAWSNKLQFFAGIHKGFAPPRIKDAISASGLPYNLDAESSMNYEVGSRFNVDEILGFELTAFAMDFDNQLIPVSVSSGNTNAAGIINGGKTMHKGIETGFKLDFAKLLGTKNSIKLESNATFQNAYYNANRFVPANGSSINVKGYQVPYSPRVMINSAISYSPEKGIGFKLATNYISSQFSDELNSIIPNANGRIGKIGSRVITDFNLFYQVPKRKISAYIAAKNIGNVRYISTRRPEGIRVGLPRLISAGLEISL